jgi:hypothetical protein
MRACLSACSVILLCVATCCTRGQEHPSRFANTGRSFQGSLWMGWNGTQRDMFIRGFLVGHDEGLRRGCSSVANVTKFDAIRTESPEDSLIGKCLANQEIFRKAASYYENFVTAFYTKYPEDRDLPLQILIEDSEDKTPEQIHEWVKKVSH